MKKVIADTNIFLRFLLDDVPQQTTEAERLFKKAASGKIHLLIPSIVLFEIEFTLRKYYKYSKEEVVDKLRLILSASHLDIEDNALLLTTLDLYESASISFVDCFLLVKAEEAKAELFTFDRKLKKQKVSP